MARTFAPVPGVGSGPDLLSDIEHWIASDPVKALIASFGGEPGLADAAAGPLGKRLAALDEFTDRWDTRQGRERNLADELPLTAAQEELTLAASDALGLREAREPEHQEYDHVLMLGGMIRACIVRPAHAAHLIRTGRISAGSVTALGGHRPFQGDEHQLAAAAGIPDVGEEFAALDAGTRLAFGLGGPDRVEGETSDLVGGTWGVNTYRTESGLDVRVAAAPAPQEEAATRRANTADTYKWFAEYLHVLQPGQRLLMITTPIYVPAQHTAAIRMLALPYKVTVETIGADPALVDEPLQQSFSPTKYLLEIRSAVRSLRSLHTALVAPA